MSYFKNTTVLGGGALCPPPNFVVSSSITIKFDVLIEFDKFFSKIAKQVSKMTSLPSHLLSQATLSFEISNFFISGRIWLKVCSGDKF